MQFDSRLKDPKRLLGDKYKECDDKISVALAKLAMSPEKGGNPFLYALAANKYHKVDNTLPFPTAATDGRNLFWHPDFLAKLPPFSTRVILTHELLHVALYHASPDRSAGRYKFIWAMAIDFIVNTYIELEWRKNNGYSEDKTFSIEENPFWSKVNFADGEGVLSVRVLSLDNVKSILINNDNTEKLMEKLKEKDENGLEIAYLYADVKTKDRTAEDIYNEILQHLKDNDVDLDKLMSQCMCDVDQDDNGDGQDNGDGEGEKESNNEGGSCKSKKKGEGKKKGQCPKCGKGSAIDEIKTFKDNHKPTNYTKEQILKELLRAKQASSKMRGSTPGFIEEFINELSAPQLSWPDYCVNAMKKIAKEKGKLRNWTSFRRRFINQGLYIPKTKGYKANILVMLDTSGSMSQEDLSLGMSEIKTFTEHAYTWVIPVDAEPHWEAISKVRKDSDVPKVKIVGRGGTVFEEFFRDYHTRLRKEGPFDLILVITDGYCDRIPEDYTPNCQVAWVFTENHIELNQPFGKMFSLSRTKTTV